MPESGTFEPLQLDQVCNLGARKGYLRFCGEMTYSIPFEVAQSDLDDAEQVCVNLGKVFESVEVLVNHQNCGTAIAPPYVFYVTQCLKVGKNELTIKIQNNMGRGFQEIFFYAKSARQVAL